MKNLEYITEQLITQDNLGTFNPIFIVQEKVRDFGYDSNYCDSYIWNDEDGNEVDKKLSKELEGKFKDGEFYDTNEVAHINGEKYFRALYKEKYEFVTACLTNKGCEDYIKANRNNLNEPRIYVKSGFRNKEWENIRKYFIDLKIKEDYIKKQLEADYKYNPEPNGCQAEYRECYCNSCNKYGRMKAQIVRDVSIDY